ncbi:MAG: PLP-dependent aminotransferase family protein [Deltaproteobacteria bacterium]|jgi:DNA-binding transcriptional MocR family regulator|nr:PLP-dependent aminotransferase family protein [Deltaproteobacteria bacterium]
MWDYKIPARGGQPRYLVIADSLERAVLSGDLAPGERLLPHRELAPRVGVTISTVSRAYAEAGRRGLVTSMVGRGTFVREGILPAFTESAAPNSIELGVPGLLTHEEPGFRPVMQKIMQDGGLEDLAKSFFPLGRQDHREVGAGWLGRAGVNATANSVLVAGGQQHALNSILSGLFASGDKIAVAQFTTPGITMLMQRAGIGIEGVMVDEDGVIPERMDELCASQTIRGVYFVGNTQNPSAKYTSPERLEALSRIVARYNLTVIEDGSLSIFNSRKNRPLAAMMPDSIVYFASLGPAIFCGLQVAFIHAPTKLHNRVSQAIVDNILAVPPLNVALACEAITGGALESSLKSKQKEMKRRVAMFRDIMCDFAVTCSEESIYAWLQLPAGWKAGDFERQAEKNGVRVFSVDHFMVGAFPPPNCIRLSLTGPSDMASLKRGLSILVGMLKKEGGVITPIW